jgi:membrane fusion protein (multidrug efflux system)
MKLWYYLILMLVLVLACREDEAETESEIPVPVTVEQIRLKPIQSFVFATGTISALKEAVLRSESDGAYQLQINSQTGRPFALGDRLRKGQVIIKLENPEQENQIRIESQKLGLETSEREFNKQKSLYDKGGVTYSELKTAEQAFIDAKYSYDNALLQLEKLKIIAPFEGILVDLPYHTPGIKISAGLTLAKIMDYSRLYMDVSLPAKDLPKVKARSEVLVTNHTLPEDTLKGHVTQVSPAIDSNTRTFKSSVVIENPELIFRPGMFVKSDIVVAQKDSAIVIPKDIILSKRRGKTVFIVEKGAASERVVSTGLENQDFTEVTNGLKVNERLVIKGFETLRNHSKVKIIQ